MSDRTVRQLFRTFIVLAALVCSGLCAGTVFANPLYFSFEGGTQFPANPSSLLVQSSLFLDVPAGAVLKAHLLRGDSLVTTSTLAFSQAYRSELLLPPAPLARFVPTGSSVVTGEPLPNALLTSGAADLAAVAAAPSLYHILWDLSAGVINNPVRVIVTNSPNEPGPTAAFVDLKLSAVSAASLPGDQKPGSVLFFNRFTSSASNSLREDTQINLTNTNPSAQVFLRIFLVSGATCQVAQTSVCLAAQETLSFLLSDLDPGTKGYLVAVATDSTGLPIKFNWLIGNAILKQPASGGSYSAVLSALAFARIKDAPATASGGSAELIFDNVDYERLPAQVAFDNVPAQANGANATLFTLYRPLADLTGGAANVTVQLTGRGAKNDQGQVITSTGNVQSACYAEAVTSQLRLQPTTISNLVPAGATAWFSASTSDLQPLLGVQTNTGEYSGGFNARPLSFSTEYRIRVPVTAVTCQ